MTIVRSVRHFHTHTIIQNIAHAKLINICKRAHTYRYKKSAYIAYKTYKT